jgi:hypothetical protein
MPIASVGAASQIHLGLDAESVKPRPGVQANRGQHGPHARLALSWASPLTVPSAHADDPSLPPCCRLGDDFPLAGLVGEPSSTRLNRLPRRSLRRVPRRRLPAGARRACSTDPESVHAAPGPAASGPHDTAELVLSSTALFAPCLALLCRPRCIGRAKVRLHSGQERRVTVTLPGR